MKEFFKGTLLAAAVIVVFFSFVLNYEYYKYDNAGVIHLETVQSVILEPGQWYHITYSTYPLVESCDDIASFEYDSYYYDTMIVDQTQLDIPKALRKRK